MAFCRHCGDPVRGADEPFGACAACAGSPLCDRCGHPRNDHGRVFVRDGGAGCRRLVADFQSLSSWSCPCTGFEPVSGALRDARFLEAPVTAAPLRIVPPPDPEPRAFPDGSR